MTSCSACSAPTMRCTVERGSPTFSEICPRLSPSRWPLRLRSTAAAREIAAALEAALPHLDRATAYMLERAGTAQRDALAGASAYLELAAAIAVGWMWLKMAAAADAAHPAEAAKPALARFFAEDALAAADLLARRAMSGAAAIDALQDAQLLA